MIFLDTETCGLNGPCVTIQHASATAPVALHEVWRMPVRRTLALIERLASSPVCGWNLSFDWFHLARAYAVLRLLPTNKAPTIAGWLDVERHACAAAPCLKPQAALDLFLHARKGPMQSLMARDDVRIRRVPQALAQPLAEHLQANLPLEAIYFSRRKDGYQWVVEEDEDRPGLPDVVLRFGARMGLKPLARHLLGVEALDYPVEESKQPKDVEWNFLDPEPWRDLLAYHIGFWATNKTARRYACDDVDLTRRMWAYFGSPPPGDDDSELACQVGAARVRGWALDIQLLEQLNEQALKAKESAPRAAKTVLHGLKERLSPIEALVVQETDGDTLEALVREYGLEHPAGRFAQDVIEARSAEKVVDLCGKLLTTRRALFSFKVLGAKSGRMSGDGKLNPQGIPARHETWKHMRDAFVLADGEVPILDGGDFDGFEVAIAAAAYGDANLIEDLQSGRKFHGLFGASVYKRPYEAIVADKDLYTRAKSAVFARFYGAQLPKVAAILNLPMPAVTAGDQAFMDRYPGIRLEQKRIEDLFCSMRQPEGIGTRVEWHEPADYVESLLGFKRFYELENRVCRALYDLAQAPPVEWTRLKLQVKRTASRKAQTAGGATQSALYAAAFQIQARNMRSATNHRIQSTGAEITKRLQRRIWDVQPVGIGPWVVQPLNVHDELEVARAEGVDLRPVVESVLEHYRPLVPLIAMEWKQGIKSWGSK